GVDQSSLDRSPAGLEIAQTLVREVGAPEIERVETVLGCPTNRRPEQEIVGSNLPVPGIGSAVLVDQRPIPAEKYRRGEAGRSAVGELHEPQVARDQLLPEKLEEPPGLHRHPLTLAGQDVQAIELAHSGEGLIRGRAHTVA